jgi:hypothetical protein
LLAQKALTEKIGERKNEKRMHCFFGKAFFSKRKVFSQGFYRR